MSDVETWRGTLTYTGQSVRELMDQYEWPDGYDEEDEDDLMEFFTTAFHGEKIALDGLVYDVKKENLSYCDIFEAMPNEEGGTDFIVQFYNGGCSFDEAIEEAVKNMKARGQRV